MENQHTLSKQCKLIIEHAVSDGGTPTLVCRGRITLETASQFRSEINTLAPKHKFLTSGVSSKAANWGHFKTGQRKWLGTVKSCTRS